MSTFQNISCKFVGGYVCLLLKLPLSEPSDFYKLMGFVDTVDAMEIDEKPSKLI
jgi:hypothetical protein